MSPVSRCRRSRLRAAAPPVLLAAVLVWVSGSIAPAAAAVGQSGDVTAPGIGIRLLDVPTANADDPRAQIYVVDHVAPGTTIERRFQVSNGDAEPFTASVYPVAATIEANRFLPADGRQTNDLASWISVDRPEVELGANDREIVTMTIDVPSDAEEGERYAAVFAERPATNSGSIGVGSRVGIRVYLSVGAGAAPIGAFEIGSVIAGRSDLGEPFVLTTVDNTGGRALDLSGDVSLTHAVDGTRAGSFEIPRGTTVAVGEIGVVETVLDPRLADGPWLARIRLESGLVERVTEAEINFPPVGSASLLAFEPRPGDSDASAPEPSTTGRSVAPWILVGALVAAGLGLLVALGSRRSLAEEYRSWTAPEPATPATVAGLSATEAVTAIAARIPFRFSATTHAAVARHLGIRPPQGQKARSLDESYCHYDNRTRSYTYTPRWVERAVRQLSTADGFRQATGRDPVRQEAGGRIRARTASPRR